MASEHLTVNGQSRPGNVRHPTAPGMMMNSHFAGVGEDAPKEAYEHGIQGLQVRFESFMNIFFGRV
jgi:hypothetical protein